MSLRFAVIKEIKTQLGNNWEFVVFEWDEKEVTEHLRDNLQLSLPKKKEPLIGPMKYTEDEVNEAFEKAWRKTVKKFKKITARIL
jgi:hypothetical protein